MVYYWDAEAKTKAAFSHSEKTETSEGKTCHITIYIIFNIINLSYYLLFSIIDKFHSFLKIINFILTVNIFSK